MKGDFQNDRNRKNDEKTMKRNYMAFHTFDPDVAIDDLIEIYQQRQKK